MKRLRTALKPLRQHTALPTSKPVSSARWSSSSSSEIKKTPLYDFHVAQGAKMVPFAGYSMPVQYSSLSVGDSHKFTRTKASLFDVSHMVQHTFTGPAAVEALERMTPVETGAIGEMQSRLSTLLWPTGGIVDDLMITRLSGDKFYVVSNAGCREKDLKFIGEQLQGMGISAKDVWRVEENVGLVALQGPESEGILKEIIEGVDLSKLYFGHSTYAQLRLADGSKSREVLIGRGGYTGEDGFEISLILPDGEGSPVKELTAITETLLSVAGPERLQLAGLGARDSLRLEAGMCLYGHDLDDTTTPVEAGLSWIISPERRKSGGFNGAETILPQLVPKSKGGQGVERRRIGLIVNGAPAREGAEIHSKEGEKIGVVTSGSPSPSLGKNIAMGYIKDGFQKSGTEVDVLVRGRKRSATVSKMPFVPTHYYKGE
jgi:aminomethyltransferase